MRQKSGPEKEPATQIVKNIRRATRRHFSAEDKIRIVLEGLRGEDSIAELCRREGIVQNLYYRWKITIAGMATATAEDKAALLKIVGRHFDGHPTRVLIRFFFILPAV
jgi:transposase-like protein